MTKKLSAQRLEQTGKQVNSKKRVADHGEVFTNPREVNAMLDLVKDECERIESTFLEPACGTGNFLVEVLARKLATVVRRYGRSQFDFELNSVVAASSIYGIELLPDNVTTCKVRLMEVFLTHYDSMFGQKCNPECVSSMRYLFNQNIIHGDALKYQTVDLLGAVTGEHIVFSQWSVLNLCMITRRDFIFCGLVDDCDDPNQISLFSDEGDKAYIPESIKEYLPVHFLSLGEQLGLSNGTTI